MKEQLVNRPLFAMSGVTIRRRSSSSEPHVKPARQDKVIPEPRAKLQNYANRLALTPNMKLSPMMHDLRGNFMSVKSTGHVHHPNNMYPALYRWACFVLRSLEEDLRLQKLEVIAARMSVCTADFDNYSGSDTEDEDPG